MGISVRSCLTTGVAAITAASVAFAPSVREPVPAASHPPVGHVASPAIRLTAQIQPLAAPTSLPGWIERILIPPSAGAPFPTPQFPPVVAPTSVGSSIIWVYNAVEPWARYVADLAAYAVGWIPYVGWLAPQITIFYNFGERIARSITYNIAFWLDGDISFTQGLINVGIDTINSFIFLANDQLAFWLPPLPPIPPIGPFAAAAEPMTAELTNAELKAAPLEATEKHTLIEPEALHESVDPDTPGDGDETANADPDATESLTAEATPADKRTTSSSSSGTVHAQGEVRESGTSNEQATDATNASPDDKGDKGDKPDTAGGATESAAASATTNDETGEKKPKDDAGEN